MSCGVNIPLSSVVEAIVNDYADVLAGEVLKRVSLNNSTINNGTLIDATIRGDLTLDDAAKGALCSALQDCIATKIQDELGSKRDNHVTDFTLTDKHLVITMKFGEVLRISKQELADFIGNTTNNSGGITGGKLTNNTTITVNNKDGSTATIDISGMGYTLKTENNHYTTQAADFNGFTIIRANYNGDQTITLTKPDDSFIGKALIVRKTNGGVGTFVTLKAGAGVTISPADSTPLRRVGSSATLVYTGGGNWDVFGELP